MHKTNNTDILAAQEAWLHQLSQRNIAKQTIRSHRRHLAVLNQTLPPTGRPEQGDFIISAFELQNQMALSSTTKYQYIRTWIRWGRAAYRDVHGGIDPMPTAHEILDFTPTYAKIQKLLTDGINGSRKERRANALLRLMYYTAGKPKQLTQINWRRSNIVCGHLSTTDQNRSFRIPPRKAHYLEQVLRNQSEPITSIDECELWETAQAGLSQIGFTRKSPFWLRLAHAAHAMERGASLQVVNVQMGYAMLMGRDEKHSSLYLM
ncbi:MAG: hypothetical protein AAF639_14845 [Chloroflexota bacterium]